MDTLDQEGRRSNGAAHGTGTGRVRLLVDRRNLGRVLVVKVGNEKTKYILLTLSAGLL